MATQPLAAIRFDLRPRFLENFPVIKHALIESSADGVTPPYHLAVDDGGVRAHMLTAKKRHRHMPGLYRGAELLGRFDNFAATTHTAHVVDRLAEHRKLARHNVMRRAV